MTYSDRDIVLYRLRGAQRILVSAIDHYERTREPCDDGQLRSRRNQASSDIAAAIGLLGEAGSLMLAEVIGEAPFGGERE
jgi:hypothetical protein